MAIISRSIEEISFIYYAVPVMCIFFVSYHARRRTRHSGEVERRETSPESDGMSKPDSRRTSFAGMTTFGIESTLDTEGEEESLILMYDYYSMISAIAPESPLLFQLHRQRSLLHDLQ